MCKKYINATASCFKSVTMEGNEIVSFNAPFGSIKAIEKENGLFIENFAVIARISFLGTSSLEHKKENPLEQGQTIDFIVRLTKCDKSEEKQIGRDLDRFSIDLKKMHDENMIGKACFGFMDYTRITNVDSLDLPVGVGKYVIKVLIKDAQEDVYTIQSMTQLTVLQP